MNKFVECVLLDVAYNEPNEKAGFGVFFIFDLARTASGDCLAASSALSFSEQARVEILCFDAGDCTRLGKNSYICGCIPPCRSPMGLSGGCAHNGKRMLDALS